jgi:urea transport system permease protein
MLMVVLVPGLLAFVFGFFAFRSRIKGVYFSIITQALTFAAMLLFFRNETGFGGNNGFTDFKRILDIPIATSQMRVLLCCLTGAVLIGFFLMARAIVNSKYGRVLQAIRDAESRVMFTGYDPVAYKLSIWTLSAVMCGVAGALYVPQVGIINPGEMSPAASIEIAIWAAVGGRATLIGPIVGAFFVNGAKSWFTVAFPEFWLFFLGALFIAVTLFLPNGMVGLLKRKKERRMTPDLMEDGARAPGAWQKKKAAQAQQRRPGAAYGRVAHRRARLRATAWRCTWTTSASASTASRR